MTFLHRLDEFGRDLYSGLRQVLRYPAFSSMAIVTLALGIGANTAVFSAVDAVLIRPLPYADADRLVMIWDDMSQIGFPKHFSTPPEWRAWRQQSTVFTDIAATQPEQLTLTGDGEPEQLPARKVTGNFWSVLGVQPLVGRVFGEEEDTQGASVAVISHRLWQRRFGGSREVAGRRVTLNDRSYEVIGVMPAAFYFLPGGDIDVWIPTSFSAAALTDFAWHDVHCVARLRPGVTLERAREEMAALSLRISAEHVEPPRAAVVTPLREELAGNTRGALLLLLGASGVILLIACLNVANLLLSRGAARRHEMAVRVALGAGRGRVSAQLFAESLVLAGLGALAGILIALPVMRFLAGFVPQTMGAVELALDGRVLVFSAIAAVAAAVAFGMAPALGLSRTAGPGQLREAGRGQAGRSGHRFQYSLIVAETALAVVLLTAGGLLLQTLQHLRQLDLGMRTDNLLAFEIPLFRYDDFEQRVAFVNDQLVAIRNVPGVSGAAAISRIPLTASDQTTRYVFPGQPAEETRTQDALSRVVTRDYFATVGAELREGRVFDLSDRRSDSPSAIVNESFNRFHFPDRSALGARFQFGRSGPDAYWYTIVGVVQDIRERGVVADLKPTVYRLHEQAEQSGDRPSGIIVRASVEPVSIVPAIRQAVWSVDRNQALARFRTIEQIVAGELSAPSRSASLLSAFALLALVLASVGLYGVLSYAVAQRTREIGVRLALGAAPRNILFVFGRRGLALTLVGLAIGLVLAAAATRVMSAVFYGFQPEYLRAAIVASSVLLAVATLSCIVPARRASRVDPVIALRDG
jgi:putative ABC transport system permease protein